MNPFDLDGPRFLLFYLCFAPAVILFWRVLWIFGTRRSDASALVDPIKIAYLRGSPLEAIRVAVLGLIERDIIERPSDIIVRTNAKTMRANRSMHALESALAAHLIDGHSAENTAGEQKLHAELTSWRTKLERLGFIDRTGLLSLRLWLFLATLATVLGVLGSKIAIAYQRGHRNFFFLIVITLIAAIVAQRVWFRSRTTTAGKQALKPLETLHHHASVTKPAGVVEVMLQAAVFGAIASSAAGNPYYGKVESTQSGGASGCGTSGGDGGGDGGGGCGGGGGD